MRRTKTVKLTAAAARSLSLPAGKTDHFYWDQDIPGFTLRVRKGGNRSLVFCYEFGGRARKLTLGAATADFAGSQERARRAYSRLLDGRDPATEREEAQREAATRFDARIKDFIKYMRDPQGGACRPRYCDALEHYLFVRAQNLHSLPLAQVEPRDVASLVADVAGHYGRDAARVTRASLSSYFRWLVGEGLIDRNPVEGTNNYKQKSRDRVLSPGELRLIWNGAGDGQFGQIVRLLTLCGSRAGEIAGLRWSEIDFDVAVIRLGPERTKNGRPHEIPLSGPAMAILQAWPRREGRDLVFGNALGPFSGWSKAKRELDERVKIPAWRVHDLRRTVSTRMHEIGVEPHIVEAVLGHISGHQGGVSGVYNRATYSGPKRAALVRWANWLMATVVDGAENNVTPFRGVAP